jgi:hypothetical protein
MTRQPGIKALPGLNMLIFYFRWVLFNIQVGRWFDMNNDILVKAIDGRSGGDIGRKLITSYQLIRFRDNWLLEIYNEH